MAAGPCADLDRAGPQEEDVILSTVAMFARALRNLARGRWALQVTRNNHLSKVCDEALHYPT